MSSSSLTAKLNSTENKGNDSETTATTEPSKQQQYQHNSSSRNSLSEGYDQLNVRKVFELFRMGLSTYMKLSYLMFIPSVAINFLYYSYVNNVTVNIAAADESAQDGSDYYDYVEDILDDYSQPNKLAALIGALCCTGCIGTICGTGMVWLTSHLFHNSNAMSNNISNSHKTSDHSTTTISDNAITVPTFKDCIQRGLSVFRTVFCTFFAMQVLVILLVLITSMMIFLFAQNGHLAFTVLGGMFLIGGMLCVAFLVFVTYVVYPIVVVENIRSPYAVLQRSLQLVRLGFCTILAVQILFTFLFSRSVTNLLYNLGCTIFEPTTITRASSAVYGDDDQSIASPMPQELISPGAYAISSIANILLVPIGIILQTLVYMSIRDTHESMDMPILRNNLLMSSPSYTIDDNNNQTTTTTTDKSTEATSNYVEYGSKV